MSVGHSRHFVYLLLLHCYQGLSRLTVRHVKFALACEFRLLRHKLKINGKVDQSSLIL